MLPSATRICAACGERVEAPASFCPRDGAPLSLAGAAADLHEDGAAAVDPRLGVELPGGVRIERLVGLGASGRVYRAHQSGVERAVAVKVLHRLGDARALARFHREARVASRIVHPNVVTVLLTGELPAAAGAAAGEPFAVLEWLDGPTLEAVLGAARAAGEALDLVRSLRVALGVAEAAGEAHRLGILHRDLKPSNVALVRRGDDRDAVKVLDFGLAKVDRGPGEPITGEGVVGTPLYLAPEAARGAATAASDVCAIASILYECLAGRPPFEGRSAAAVLAARAARDPEDVRAHARSTYVPAPIATLLARALARDPAARPADGAALARDLLHAATSAGLAAQDLLGPRLEGAGPIHLAPQQPTRRHDPRAGLTRGTPRRA